MNKKWYESKTMWINILAIVVGIGTSVLGELEAGTVITSMGLINIILRVITKNGIKF